MEKQINLITIVIPVFNEETAIGNVAAEIKSSLPVILNTIKDIDNIEVIFVDDGSTDNSNEILSKAINGLSEFKLIRHPKNCGYGAALKTGFANARGNIIVFYDGDNTFKLKNLVRPLRIYFNENLEMVSGNRFTSISKMPFIRKVGNKFYGTILRLLTNIKVLDPSSGIRIIDKEILLKKLYPLPDGLNFIIVLTTRALFNRVRSKEIQIPYEDRSGPSKLNVVKDGLRFLTSMFAIIRLNNPFVFYFFTSLCALFLSFVYGYLALHQYIINSLLRHSDVLSLIICVFFLNIALVSYTTGVIANVINKNIFGKFATLSILGQFLTQRKFYLNFNKIGFALIAADLLIYAAIKLNRLPIHYSTLILFAMLGFYGFQFIIVHYLIQTIENQLGERKELITNLDKIYPLRTSSQEIIPGYFNPYTGASNLKLINKTNNPAILNASSFKSRVDL